MTLRNRQVKSFDGLPLLPQISMIYLLIEYIDELVFGVGETAWPLFRNDLHLSYTQIGLLLSLPGIIAAFIEPFIGVLGDVWKRRVLILVGGLLFTLSLFMTSASFSFARRVPSSVYRKRI